MTACIVKMVKFLQIGASTSGPGRLSATGASGEASYGGTDRAQDIDMMAYFSSTGPALDGRIKPDVVAPGDMVSSSPKYECHARLCKTRIVCSGEA